MQQGQMPGTEGAPQRASGAVSAPPQSHCNTKQALAHEFTIQRKDEGITVSLLPCQFVLKDFVPEFNSGSHKSKKMRTR